MKAVKVNIALKDGTRIDKCWVYPTDVRGRLPIHENLLPIQHEHLIHQLFQACGKGRACEVIFFQTSMMNGHIPVANVDTYEIIEVDKRE
ncbi:hypothetical protein C4A75_09435 [Brevibacillus laterosporus]|uniref:hypothetical protein n=1 Tax=Brevibacillus laterosporus TaxID=1465 RepID=UPI000CE44166|nr:hypothetical protein [Brevibacillus laterosporus]PPA84989.1 hypothetical protein C4A75_09435 [Brevibacillus laterosporus]